MQTPLLPFQLPSLRKRFATIRYELSSVERFFESPSAMNRLAQICCASVQPLHWYQDSSRVNGIRMKCRMPPGPSRARQRRRQVQSPQPQLSRSSPPLGGI